ncbi:MAG TPA: beta-ketoacyl-ACP synthase III [Symbiobacteriaceae bacterium]|nr:beta-ketoacyl-ACP synthase III [Symbiobacteriaceae bacterium]
MRRVGIAGIGVAIPEKCLTNEDLAKFMDTSDEWIRSRTGIRERRLAEPHEATSDYAIRAARQAMERAGVEAEEIDLIIVATVTGDMPFPSTACLVQDAIGAKRAGAFDLQAACPGWIYGMTVAEGMIASGRFNCILVIGAEMLSKLVSWADRSTAVLFGDGAGAAILKPVQEGGIQATLVGADGSGGCNLYVPAGGSRRPTTAETVAEGAHFVKMNGQEVFKFAVRVMNEATGEILAKAGWTADQIDLLVPHQANGRIIDAAVKRLGLPAERVVVNVDRYANTSSASIPIALWEAQEAGRLKPGDKVVCVSFGAGLVWGALALEWTC